MDATSAWIMWPTFSSWLMRDMSSPTKASVLSSTRPLLWACGHSDGWATAWSGCVDCALGAGTWRATVTGWPEYSTVTSGLASKFMGSVGPEIQRTLNVRLRG